VGKKILGLAKHMLEIENKAEKPQDNLPRSQGFIVDDDDDLIPTGVAKKPSVEKLKKRHKASGAY